MQAQGKEVKQEDRREKGRRHSLDGRTDSLPLGMKNHS